MPEQRPDARYAIPDTDRYPEYRSHYRPRTRTGLIAVVSFLLLFALTQPPAVYLIGNRIEPRVLGMPFLYTYLLVIYVTLIGVLMWAQRRRI
ncbi:MAG: hypothetical protein ACE5PT_02795 [Gemmatimonadales bacterium]